MRINVNIDGVDDTISRLRAYEITKRESVKRIIAETATKIDRDAVALTPVDTGNLKSGWHTQYFLNGFTAEVSNPVYYAPYIEFGTVKMRAQPMLTPAYERNIPSYITSLRRELENIR